VTTNPIKILFFADTHLGFDLPLQPRIQRRRRGDDFFANYHHILTVAQAEKVDLVIHGGDLFFRSKLSPWIVDKTFNPLVDVANAGIPIYLVPGNHERSKLPGHLWLAHSNIHVFDKPKTFHHEVGGFTIALSGFPFTRKVKTRFHTLLAQTSYKENNAGIRFLCLHQTFEGAKVGPGDFTFRTGVDNIPGSEIPEGFSAVLSGHIHRGQTLTHTLAQLPLSAPVIYPGSIERTSFAERFEEKHYVLIKIFPSVRKPQLVIEFHPLPTRPMVKIKIPTQNNDFEGVKILIQKRICTLAPDSIVRIQLTGPKVFEFTRLLSAIMLRSLAPPTMNISLVNVWRNSKEIHGQ